MKFQCEADNYKSLYNKDDLISLIVKHKKRKDGSGYKKKDFKKYNLKILKGIYKGL